MPDERRLSCVVNRVRGLETVAIAHPSIEQDTLKFEDEAGQDVFTPERGRVIGRMIPRLPAYQGEVLRRQ